MGAFIEVAGNFASSMPLVLSIDSLSLISIDLKINLPIATFVLL
jgi:hypothetical protein